MTLSKLADLPTTHINNLIFYNESINLNSFER